MLMPMMYWTFLKRYLLTVPVEPAARRSCKSSTLRLYVPQYRSHCTCATLTGAARHGRVLPAYARACSHTHARAHPRAQPQSKRWGSTLSMMTPHKPVAGVTPVAARTRGPATPSPSVGTPLSQSAGFNSITPTGVKRTRAVASSFTPPTSKSGRTAVTPGSNSSLLATAHSSRLARARSQGWKGSGQPDDPVRPSPTPVLRSKFVERTDAGDVVVSWSPPSVTLPEPTNKPYRQAGMPAAITLGMPADVASATCQAYAIDVDDLKHATEPANPPRYMAATLAARASQAEDEVLDFIATMTRHNPELATQLGKFGSASAVEQVFMGRVVVAEGEGRGKLIEGAVMLEGLLKPGAGARVRLQLTGMNNLAMFAGQCVAVRARAVAADLLVVSEVLGMPPPPVATIPAGLVRQQVDAAARQKAGTDAGAASGMLSARGGGPLRIWAAAGPYTMASDLEFLPLDDLLHEVESATPPPDVLILAGPFLENTHPAVLSGELKWSTTEGTELAVDARVLVAKQVIERVHKLCQAVPALRVVMLPSERDVLGQPVLPGPPMPHPAKHIDLWYQAWNSRTDADALICAGNPAYFTVGEGGMATTIGMTSTDVLFDLNRSDLYKVPRGAERQSRTKVLASHLLEQRSWYPLSPAAEGTPTDSTLPALRMPVAPDILLLPGRLRPEAVLIHNTVVVNPGTLCKATSGGTYAELEIFPHQDMPLAVKSAGDEVVPTSGALRTRITVRHV